jgi:hypothetical protein
MKTEEDKEKNPVYPRACEGKDFHQEIKLQIQKVTKETAKLIGLLEGGLQTAGIDSPEYRGIREFGTTFLNELVRVAGRLDIQLQ